MSSPSYTNRRLAPEGIADFVSLSALTQKSGHHDDLEAHRIESLPVLVLSPHNQCDCHCLMCDIWKIRKAAEISLADLERQVGSLRELGVGWVVLSGGEPQKNSQLPLLAGILRQQGIRVTLLTAGLLLASQAETIVSIVDDVIVSLDGPPEVHNLIRRVPDAFQQLAAGVMNLRAFRPDIEVRARCTVQRLNHHSLCRTVACARALSLNSISFLAADTTSAAFNRSDAWSSKRQSLVSLTANEIRILDYEVQQLITAHDQDLASGFIAENPKKLRRIVHYFRSCLGEVDHLAPRCNAPWVSAVIEASGEVRPCFFHPPLGNIHEHTLAEIVNGPRALQFRRQLDVATNATCQRCVCSLYMPKTVATD